MTALLALLSGTVGALISAGLTYLVLRKLHHNEHVEKQRRLTYVHFIRLTDFVAADFLIKEILSAMSADVDEEDDFELSHAVAAIIAEKLKEMDNAKWEQLISLIKPVITMVEQAMDSVMLAPAELAELPRDSVYFYNLYMTSCIRMKAALRLLESLLERGHPLLDESPLHALYDSYREHASAAGLLRESLRQSGAISSNHSLGCLQRSFERIRGDVLRSMGNTSKLEAASESLRRASGPKAGE